MIINTEDIKAYIFESGLTCYRMSKETGLNEVQFHSYRKGKAKVDNMLLSSAVKIQKVVNEKRG